MKFKDLKDFPYSSEFASIKLKPIVTQEADKYLATASLDQIRKFIPDVSENNYDLLPVAFNACVINRVNKNDDVISTDTALASYKNFIYKQINLEHNRKNVVGVILSAGFTEFGSDKALTEEEVKGMTKPFNITLGGVVWRIVNSDLAGFIEESNDPSSPYYLQVSASWEVGFTDYKLAVLENGQKNLEDALIISDAEEIDKFKTLLKAYQGTGRIDENKRVYRVPTDNFIPLGIGLTEKPAAEVKGVAVPLNEEIEAAIPPQFQKKDDKKKEGDEEEEEDTDKKDGKKTDKEKDKKSDKNKGFPPKKKESKEEEDEETEEDEEDKKNSKDDDVTVNVTVQANENHNNNQKIISQAEKSHVNEERTQTMTIKTLKDLTSITDESLKQCSAATIAEVVQQHLTEKAEEYAKEKARWEDELKNATSVSKTASASLEEFKKKFDEVEAKVVALEAEKAAKEQVEKFNARMSEIVAAYNLDDEARGAVVEDVKAITSDEDFEKYKKKAAILLKGFAKTEAKKEEKKQEEAAASVVDDAIDKAEKDKGGLPNGTSHKKSIAELAAQAFNKDSYTIKHR